MTTLTTAPARPYAASAPIAVERWPSERPLFAASLLLAILIWVALIVSIVGIAYAALLGVFFFFAHVAFIAHVRGSGVRLGPDQFPELHARVEELARRMGIARVPETYLIQAGGSLNALATRFLRSHMVILFSDLLEACGDDHAARDMIVGHELGHIRAGHLRWHWFLLPARLVPFLGTALSRAREYTCDRFGLAAAGDREGAALGLTILAAGGAHGRRVNRQAMVRQRVDLNTGWMTLGEWLSTHPPLAKRLVALDPALGLGQRLAPTGPARAVVLLAALTLVAGGGFGAAALVFARLAATTAAADEAAVRNGFPAPLAGEEQADAYAALQQTVTEVIAFLDGELAAGRPLPGSYDELGARYTAAYPDRSVPMDPFDQNVLGYTPSPETGTYTLWSSGPDAQPGTDDDLVYESGA